MGKFIFSLLFRLCVTVAEPPVPYVQPCPVALPVLGIRGLEVTLEPGHGLADEVHGAELAHGLEPGTARG